MDQPAEGYGNTPSPRKNYKGLRSDGIHMHVASHNIYVPRQDFADDEIFIALSSQ